MLCHGLLENRVSNRMVPGTPKYNGLQSLLPFWTIPQYQTHPRRTSAFGSPHRASCRQLLLVSTRLTFQWISDKISNQEKIGHLSDAKPWKTMRKTIFWMDLKHEQLIIIGSLQSKIGMRLLQMWGGYNHKNWEWRLGAFKNAWILGMCQNSSLKTWHNIWRFREDASQKPWIPL